MAVPKPAPNTERSDTQEERTPTLTTEALFGDGRELVIAHKGSLYRLRITRQDKLILTK